MGTYCRDFESFQYLTIDWWNTLPIQHRFETFPTYSDELLSVEGDRLLVVH